jgi:2-dehydro-3-deoxyphosphogluconate aldolase/(4S)-4-hydroxy-2-oxoglutarate aldolase
VTTIDGIMQIAPVIPVLVIEKLQDALPIAEALVAGGLPVLEVTLRTPCALEAIKLIKEVPGAIVGAGTVLNSADLDAALAAGSEFIVSPGLTKALGAVAKDTGVPFLPGIASASDLMLGLDLGFDRFKFFPAEALGGIAALQALSGPFNSVRFCPTGGITLAAAGNWLKLESVVCVGGSWMVPRGSVDVVAIEAGARAARALVL